VRSIVPTGDSLWLATDAGLGVVTSSASAPRLARPVIAAAPSWFTRSISALARSDTLLAVAGEGRIAFIDLQRRTAVLPPGNPDISRLGDVFALAIDARTLWIAAERGAAVMDRATGVIRSLDPVGTLPESVLDVALTSDHAWLATPSGLVRLRRLPDGSVR
jgi:hypothetical protein